MVETSYCDQLIQFKLLLCNVYFWYKKTNAKFLIKLKITMFKLMSMFITHIILVYTDVVYKVENKIPHSDVKTQSVLSGGDCR